VDQSPKPEEQESQAPPGAGEPKAAESEHWSPFSTSRARWAWGLMALFSVIYFAVAVLTSAEFAELAATMIFGLPLGFYLGIGVIIAGLIITRVYLAKIES
jgi:putative solute:sodium symporter small subunit